MKQEQSYQENNYGINNETISREFLERIEREKKSLGGSSENLEQVGCALFLIFTAVVCALLYFLTPKTHDTARGIFDRMVSKVSETTKEWFLNRKTTSLDYEIPKIKKGYLLVANSTDKEAFDVSFEVNDGTWCAKKDFGSDLIAISEKGSELCDGTRLVALNNQEKKYVVVNMVTGEITHSTTGDDTIDNARKETYKVFALNYVKNVQTTFALKMTEDPTLNLSDGTYNGTTFTLKDGTKIPVEVNTFGMKPTDILLTVQNGNVVGGAFVIEGYFIHINGDGSVDVK